MANLLGQRLTKIEDVGAVNVPADMQHVVGTTATKLTRPAAGASQLVLTSDKGGFRVRLGDFVSSGMPSTEFPEASVTDGTGALLIPDSAAVVMAAPDAVTVKGYAANSVLTYWWI